MAEDNEPTPPEPTNGNGAIGAVRPADITHEMQTAYLDYAMSVIVARALPDVRDGLKPVHRRILYAMWHDLSLTYDKPHKKSARIVGEVLGKYHPHGDSAVYDAMVRMAQDFSLRYPLVDGQGNFGSIDGDNAAAMRYTEARLAKIANLMLEDLEKETVGWHPNFDNTLREPDILPATLPNLLINGSSGIAVGMATNIPPHNLGEVVDALLFLIDRFDKVDEITTEELMHFIKGPDFPTGGILYRFHEDAKEGENADAIAQGYAMGKSRLIMQAKAHFEEISRGRTRIIVTELPYQTNKTALIERIADLVRNEKILGISDLRDESDRTGMRIVIEMTRNVEPKDVLADLYKYTPLQQTFGMQLLALVDGQPRLLSLKRMLQLFVQHRQEVIRRRSIFDLKRAKERAHIVEGLLRALDILDEVIHTIRHSQTVDTARKNLMANFKFSELQAQAILDMQLRRLAALERKRLQEEYDDLKKRIAYLEDLLAHPHKILGVIKDELAAIKEEYADARRTQIVDRTRGALTTHDLIAEQAVWVSLSKAGELRRQPVSKPTANVLRQIGRDSQVALLTANTRDLLYVFSKDGRCSRIGIHELPEDGASRPVAELTGFGAKDEITAAVVLPRDKTNGDAGFLCFCTAQGVVKRVALADLQNNTNSEFTVLNVDSGDRLAFAFMTQGGQELLLVSAAGQSIRFGEDEVRVMGLPAGGVGGMKLKAKDQIVFAGSVRPDGELATFTALGYAKRSPLAEYSSQGRNGGGIVAHKVNDRTGPVATAAILGGGKIALTLVSIKGVAKAMTLNELPVMGRAVLGKLVITVAGKDTVAALWVIDGTLSADGGGEGAAEAAPPKRTGDTKRTPAPKLAEDPASLQPALVKTPPAATPPTAAPPPARAPQPTTPTPFPLKTALTAPAKAQPVPAPKPKQAPEPTPGKAQNKIQGADTSQLPAQPRPRKPDAPAAVQPTIAQGLSAPAAQKAAAKTAAPAQSTPATAGDRTAEPPAAPDPTPVAFDFVADLGAAPSPPTKKKGAGKVATVVSVPASQAKTTKQDKR